MIYGFRKISDKTLKTIMIIVIIFVLILSGFAFISYYNQVKSEAYSYTPYSYTNQWQNAMAWVRNNTATNANPTNATDKTCINDN